MSDEIRIRVITKSKPILDEGEEDASLELIFTESILMLEGSDKVIIDVPAVKENFKMLLQFVDDENQERLSGVSKIINDNLEITYFNWVSKRYIENVNPMLFSIRGNKYFVKVRTSGHREKDTRSLLISLWKKTKENV